METPATQPPAAPCSARATDTAHQQGVSWSADLAAYLRTHPAADPASEAGRAALVDAVLRQPEAPAAWLAFLEAEASPALLLGSKLGCTCTERLSCRLMHTHCDRGASPSGSCCPERAVEKNLSPHARRICPNNRHVRECRRRQQVLQLRRSKQVVPQYSSSACMPGLPA